MAQGTIDDLRKVIGLSELPEEHLQWIFDHSEYREYEDGGVLAKTGEPADFMFMVFEGKVDYYSNVNGQLVYYVSFENDNTNGGITGIIPHSRMKVMGGTAFAV